MRPHILSDRDSTQPVRCSIKILSLTLALFSILAPTSGKGASESISSQTQNETRERFARERRPLPSHGLYEDFRGRVVDGALWFPKFKPDGAPIPESGSRFVGLTNAQQELSQRGVTLSTNLADTVHFETHFLADKLTESHIHDALTNGHFYVANDWLCDPTGFTFGAMNNLGVFTMGDSTPNLGKSKIMAFTPLAAKLRLYRDGTLVQETTGTNLTIETKDTGSYRVEAWLDVDGMERPWIYSNPVYLKAPDLLELASLLPSMEVSADVEKRAGITYREGAEADASKHKLDVYSPRGKSNAPVLFFIHGGAWKTGDRSQYPSFGNRFTREGYVTVVPSYRLAPKNPHPAQIEDVAAAFAWTVRHIGEYGGDTNRIFVSGHSAGGHLCALLSLDDRHLTAYQLSPKNIRGVLALSGVYDLSEGETFNSTFSSDLQLRKNASPLFHVKRETPPFLVTYCQWDYFSLPQQAKDFVSALQKAGASAELVYVPGQSHISEMLNITKADDLTVAAALKFMK